MRGEEGGTRWWNKECEMKKEEARRKLRRWRRIGEERYRKYKQRGSIRSFVTRRKERRTRGGRDGW